MDRFHTSTIGGVALITVQFLTPLAAAQSRCTSISGATVCPFAAPSLKTEQAIEALTPKKDDGYLDEKELNIKEVEVNPTKRPGVEAEAPVHKTVPFVAQNSIILQFQPDLSQKDVDDYITSNHFEVMKKFPAMGSVQVKTDLSRFFKPKSTDTNTNESALRGFVEASKEFKKDPRILAAIPDVVWSAKSDDINKAETDAVIKDIGDAKVTDWGIQDIQAEQLWEKPGATDGAIFGVLDGGFAKHDDLVFIDLKKGTPVADHGTHVSGFRCSRWPS